MIKLKAAVIIGYESKERFSFNPRERKVRLIAANNACNLRKVELFKGRTPRGN